jgi:hypothetical protein
VEKKVESLVASSARSPKSMSEGDRKDTVESWPPPVSYSPDSRSRCATESATGVTDGTTGA